MLNWLYLAVAKSIVAIHAALAVVLGSAGLSWWLSIVVLTAAVRLVLFPLFVRQIKSQRTLQLMQPKMKEIREKYKNDRDEMNRQLMALQAEHGNPLLGCLPIFAQIPLFIALFHVLRSFAPIKNGPGGLPPHALAVGTGFHFADHSATFGLNAHVVSQVATAKVFGVPLAGVFTSTASELHALNAGSTSVKIVAAVLIALMAATTFLTQRQVMARSGPMDPQQQSTQRIMMGIVPLFLLFTGTRFPIGVLVYWLTTNLWSMGQQYVVLRRMPAPGSAAALALAEQAVARPAAPDSRPTVGRKPERPTRRPEASSAPVGGDVIPTGTPRAPGAPVAAAARRPNAAARPNRRGRGQRRGGRH